MRTLALLIVSTCVFGALHAEDTADFEMYVDYPIGLWDMSSTGPIDKANTEYTHSYNNSIKYTLNAGNQATITHTWYGEWTTDIIHWEFWVRPAGTGLENMRLKARVFLEAPRPSVRLGDITGPIPPGVWTKVVVPLSALSVVEGEVVHYLYFDVPQNLPIFWLDDMKFVKRDPPLTTTTIDLQPNAPFRALHKRMFGVGVHCQDNTLELSESRSRMMEAGILFMNFPGGTNTDLYDWESSTNNQTGVYCRLTTEKYLQLAEAIGADKMIAANYGSGTPVEAAAWVEYANNVMGGNVINWSIGNECYHPGEYDTRPPPFDHDAETYAAFCVQAIQLMKGVDPRVKIGVVGTYGEQSWPQRITVINPVTGVPANGWSAVLLTRMREAGVLPDYFDMHLYTVPPGKESDALLFQNLDRIDFWITPMKRMLTDYLGPAGENIPINLTESNSTWGRPGPQNVSLTNAMYLMYQWGQMAKRNLESWVWWKLHNQAQVNGNDHPSLYGWRDYSDFGILARGLPEGVSPPLNTRYPTFYAMKMLKKFARPGDEMFPVTTNNMHLKVFGCKSASGRIRLLVINAAKTKDIPVRISAGNQLLPGSATLHRYGATEDVNERDISTTYVTFGPIFGGSFRTLQTTINRYSINLIEF
ncbi:MAG: hypothetical protein H0W86_01655 [Armatimonadetes bacterium]|nr:hypothetical protein [Armatimonadota bacterium]